MMNSLTVHEQAELEQHEATIERGLQTFVEVGLALRAIRDKRLYRQNYTTFEDYCRERWNFDKRRAYQLMDAAQVVNNVNHGSHLLPANERQARPLTGLPPDEQREAWREAVETAPNGRVTAKHVEAVVARRSGNGHRELAAYEREFNRPVYDDPDDTSWLDDDEYGPPKRDDRVTRTLTMSESNEWYTPQEYVEAARRVMGGIDTDPASNDTAQGWIQAGIYYTKDDDGLAQEWQGRVWLNPPYGGLSGRFVAKLFEEIAAGRVTEAVVLVNANSTETKWFAPLWHHTLCFTNHRINFYSPTGSANGSTHGSVFVYIGPNDRAFYREFARYGYIVRMVRYDDQES